MPPDEGTKENPPGSWFPEGVPLAENFGDGEACGSTLTFSGEPCRYPARFGRDDVEDSSDTACWLHTDEVSKCGAPTLAGGRCLLEAGLGTDRDTGFCHWHSEDHQEDRRQVMAEFIVWLGQELTVKQAAEKVGVHRRTIWLWRKLFEDFDLAVSRMMAGHVPEKRLEVLEDVLFKNLEMGNGSSAEMIFSLCNLSAGDPGSWKDVKLIQHSHRHSGGVLLVPGSEGEDWGESAREQQEALQERTQGRQIEATVREARDVD